MDETAIIAAAQNGDREAFGMLVERYAGRLYNILVHAAGPSEAEDVLQETFMKAFANIRNFHGNSTFYTWLFRIALNSARSLHRKKRPSTLEQSPGGSDPFDRLQSAPAESPQVSLEKEETARSVRQALSRLEESERTLILLREIDRLSYEEIAAVMGVSVPAVRSRLHRTRAKLVKILEKTLP